MDNDEYEAEAGEILGNNKYLKEAMYCGFLYTGS
jgi:hypothetical protein